MKVVNEQSIFTLVNDNTGNINNLFKVLAINDISINRPVKTGQTIDISIDKSNEDVFIITQNPNIELPKKVKSQQNWFDLTCQYYGDLALLFTLLMDNNLNLDKNLQSGINSISINSKQGNNKIKKYITLHNCTLANKFGISGTSEIKYLYDENGNPIYDDYGNQIIVI